MNKAKFGGYITSSKVFNDSDPNAKYDVSIIYTTCVANVRILCVDCIISIAVLVLYIMLTHSLTHSLSLSSPHKKTPWKDVSELCGYVLDSYCIYVQHVYILFHYLLFHFSHAFLFHIIASFLIVAYQVYVLLRDSHNRKRTKPPSSKMATIQACIVFLSSFALGLIRFFLQTGTMSYSISVALFFMLSGGVSIIFLLYICTRICIGGFIPKGSRVRELALYFLRIILVSF